MTASVSDGHVAATHPATPGAAPTPEPGSRPLLLRALVMLLGAAAAVVVLGGVRATAWLIGPAFLALVLVIALSPVQSWLRRHDWPGWLTTIVLIVAVIGLLDSAVLAIVGVPLPLLWGVLAFITNYVPNVGFVIGLVPPALLALLTLGLPEMLVVIAAYCVLNFVIQSLVQPRFVGDSVGLAMTTTFISLVFWAWLLGPLGALLAIPLTLLVKALLVDVDPTARWATALAGSLAPEPRRPRNGRRARAAPGASPVVPAG
jgi:predicted PurR-regulated permease PerM